MLKLWLTLPILLSACLKDETVAGYADPELVYLLEEVDGEPYPERATISFPEPGRVAGQAPCNSYSASLTAPYPWFAVDTIAATRRACPALAHEAAFFEALRAATLIEVSGPVLILSNDAGLEMVFRAGQD